MGGHWFDRLARTHAALSQPGVGGSAGLTRRDALARAGAATLGMGAVSALGAIPAVASAAPRPRTARASDAQLAACGACNKETDKRVNHGEYLVTVNMYKYAPLGFGVPMALYVVELIGLEAGRYAALRKCADGVCNPQSYNPAPSATPATEVETGAPICPGGTHDCGIAPGLTTHYCCFGTDVCCNGTCCIADVGCACATG